MKIIVTGDDFGKSEDLNNAIELCHNTGTLTSTSLVANGKAYESAVNILRRHPTLGVGVHLAIDGVDPISIQPSSIIDPLTNKFYSCEAAVRNAKMFKYRIDDLIKEYCLQIEKVLDSGISITHLDHHHHLHLYWPVLEAIIKVANRYKIPYIRSQRLLLHNQHMLHKNLYRCVLQLYLKTQSATTDGYLQFVNKEYFNMYNRLIKLLNSNYKIVEIITHPCGENEHEVSFLTDKRVIQLMKSYNLVNFGSI